MPTLRAFCREPVTDELVATLRSQDGVGRVVRHAAAEAADDLDVVDTEVDLQYLLLMVSAAVIATAGLISDLPVALAAGVASMVVFLIERGRAAVGVGVSITTIPAAAFIGIALADGRWSEAGDAAVVLTVNVVCVVSAAVVTGALLRSHLHRRSRATRSGATPR